jgi:hypothetical protein
MSTDVPVIDSRSAFISALHWGAEAAAARQARRIVLADADFAEWPLDDAWMLQRLARWLRLPQRRLVLLARSYDALPRRCPRFCAWRRDWSHAIEPHVVPGDLAADLPTLLVADAGITVHLVDGVHWRGRASADPRDARTWVERCDVVLQRSEPGWAVHTLGL